MPQTSQGNKRIAINTIIIYIRMIMVALIGIVTTRYVLQALGVSDYGLYNVVGGIVSIMSFVCTAMITTTRRFVNIEMGKGNDGNLNKIFNVSLVLHIGFALLIYVIALSFGLCYIYKFLNVDSSKLSDAIFVFFISTTTSAFGIINVPFQALMTAYERFKQMAIIDFSTTFLKIPLVVLLVSYSGNQLRFYAIGMCLIVLISLILYHFYCKYHFRDIIKWNFYRKEALYKEILLFNNYTAMGAFAYIGRSSGSTMVINYFFGTLVNGAYAVAVQIESQIQNLVGNLSTAANPQMTQSYGAGNFQRSFDLVCRISRFSSLFMIILTFSVFVELEMFLSIWLKDIPVGAVIFCQAMLFSLFFRSFGGSVDSLIQATGKVKWYQITQSIFLILGLPLAFILFSFGYPAEFIIYSFILCDIIRTIAMFVIVCNVSEFSFKEYAYSVYLPLIKIVLLLGIYYFLYRLIPLSGTIMHFMGFLLTFVFICIVCFIVGLTKTEKLMIVNGVTSKIK